MRPAPHSRLYGGLRRAGGGAGDVGFEDQDGSRHRLDPRFDLRTHSLDGFQWGYGGSGPAQLALALVADATGDDWLAQAVYQRFKEEIIAPITGDSWVLLAENVAAFARSLQIGERVG
jgi:hypothetical protein